MPEDFPAVQGGGSLILAWQIRNKKVLVVGGGEVNSTMLMLLEIIDIDYETGGSWPDTECPEC